MNIQSQAKNPVPRGLFQLFALAFAVLLQCSAYAQVREEALERGSHRNFGAVLRSGALDFIDLSSTAPGQRPRGSLRFRFESATRALRGFGVEADECRTLLRSTSNRSVQANGNSEGIRLGLSVTLNCSFF
ncbi:MAG: hypothetical protein JF606_07015 [Burkholderiales bacterium]|jgi:hypothetical protein|nr:hypothetical protein [Burkholderiales bacterium]